MLKKAGTLLSSDFLKKFSIYGFGQFFNLVTPLLVAPYIINICGEEGFGKIGIGISLVFILTVLVDFSSGINGVKEISINREQTKEIQNKACTLFFVKFILLFIVFLISAILILFIPYLHQEKELFLLSMMILLSQALNPTWFLQGIERFKTITIITVSGKITYIVLVFLCVKRSEDYIFVNFYYGISSIISSIICLLWLVKYNYLAIIIPKKQAIKSLIKRDYKLTLSQLLLAIQQYSPILIVGYFGNNVLAGHYKIIEQIIMIFRTYLQVLFNFIYSKVCYLIMQNPQNGIKKWFIFNGVNFLMILFGLAIVFVFAYQILAYFNVTDIEKMVFCLRTACLIPLILAINIPLQQLVLAFNFQRKYVNVTVFTSIFLIFSIITAFSTWKLSGVFMLMTITELLIVLLYLYTLRNILFK